MNDTPGMSIVEFCVYIYGMGGDRHGRHAWDWILYMLDGPTLKEGNGINVGSTLCMDAHSQNGLFTWKGHAEYGVCYCGK